VGEKMARVPQDLTGVKFKAGTVELKVLGD
jgi:hypothetical protein